MQYFRDNQRCWICAGFAPPTLLMLAVVLQGLVFSPFAYAQSTAYSGLYSFLRSDASARAAALGGAFVAIHDDASAVFYNPAVIASAEENHVSATFYKHVLDINAGFLVINTSLDSLHVPQTSSFARGSVAFTANYVNYGQFERADRVGNRTGTFGGADIALGLTYANELDTNWVYGVTAKYISNRLDNASAGAFAVDAGMLYRLPKANVNIAVSVLNAGVQVATLGNALEALPLDVRLGVNHRLRGLPLLLNVGFARLADYTPNVAERLLNFSIGGEFYFGSALRVRIGYDNQRRRSLAADTQPRLAGFSGGVGVAFPTFALDYAFVALGIPGNTHRITLGWKL
jgi:hypothetical protein